MRHQEALEARVDKTPVDITTLKPSELIELALADLEWVEKHPTYVVNMDVWHEPADPDFDAEPEGTCLVCFAGSVLAHTLNHSPDAEWCDFANLSMEVNSAIDDRMYALNDFRRGYIEQALCAMESDLPDTLQSHIPVCAYDDNPTLFKRDMRGIIKLLQEHDL